jgi:hypothetical protein
MVALAATIHDLFRAPRDLGAIKKTWMVGLRRP